MRQGEELEQCGPDPLDQLVGHPVAHDRHEPHRPEGLVTTPLIDEDGLTIGDVGRTLVGANAYLGIDAILPAIETEADVVITGRVADPSLFLAPIVAEYGWARDDWQRLGQGTMVGHLMECGMQITGGYFADPGRKDVPRPADCGYPIAEIDAEGTAVITKLRDAGGMVSSQPSRSSFSMRCTIPGATSRPT